MVSCPDLDDHRPPGCLNGRRHDALACDEICPTAIVAVVYFDPVHTPGSLRRDTDLTGQQGALAKPTGNLAKPTCGRKAVAQNRMRPHEGFCVGRLVPTRAPVPPAGRLRSTCVDANLEATRVQPIGKRLDAARKLSRVRDDGALCIARRLRFARSVIIKVVRRCILRACFPALIDLQRVPAERLQACRVERQRHFLDYAGVDFKATKVPRRPRLGWCQGEAIVQAEHLPDEQREDARGRRWYRRHHLLF